MLAAPLGVGGEPSDVCFAEACSGGTARSDAISAWDAALPASK